MTQRKLVVATSPSGRLECKEDPMLMRALAARGVDADLVDWENGDYDWGHADLVLVKSTWDYAAEYASFLGWCERVSRTSKLYNAIDTIRWNVDKRYLGELNNAGIPTVPTVYAERGSGVRLENLVESHGWEEVVIKPVVSGGAADTFRVAVNDASASQFEELLGRQDMMVQPFLDRITTHGELSLMFVDGEYSHTVAKRPRAGDFRVQETFGGSVDVVDPGEDARAVAAAALVHRPEELLYARVDVALDDLGNYMIMELELIEPELFLWVDEDALARFAGVLEARLGRL